jgi:hypothetical protein
MRAWFGSVTPGVARGAGFTAVLAPVPENAMAATMTAEITTIVMAWAFRGNTPVGFPVWLGRTGRDRTSSFSNSGMCSSRTPRLARQRHTTARSSGAALPRRGHPQLFLACKTHACLADGQIT